MSLSDLGEQLASSEERYNSETKEISESDKHVEFQPENSKENKNS